MEPSINNLVIRYTNKTSHPIYFKHQDKNRKIGLGLDGAHSPFGVERYNNSLVLNIEKPTSGPKTELDKWDSIKKIEAIFQNLPSMDQESIPPRLDRLKQLIGDRQFNPSTRQRRKFPILLRTRLHTRFGVVVNGKRYDKPFKHLPGCFRVILNSIWIKGDNYGLNWLTSEVDLDPKVLDPTIG